MNKDEIKWMNLSVNDVMEKMKLYREFDLKSFIKDVRLKCGFQYFLFRHLYGSFHSKYGFVWIFRPPSPQSL